MTNHELDFQAPAALRKWPSLNGQRNANAEFKSPYLIFEGTLDECIKEFLSKPAAHYQLYELHTNPQPPLVTEVMGIEHIRELARMRDFL